MKNIIQVKTTYYFPKTVRAIGAVFCIFGLAMIWATPVVGLLFIFVTTVIFSTHYGFEIILGANTFREFVWVLGWKDGKRSGFKAIEFFFIQPGKFSFLTYALSERTVSAFEGYIKFDGRNEVHILTDTSKERLIAKIEALAKKLEVPIRDYSEGNPIDLFTPKKKIKPNL